MLKIAGIQMHCTPNPADNLKRALDMAGLAADRGARVIGFSQLFTLPWFPADSRPENFRYAEPLEGPTVETLRAFARQHGVVLVGSIFERAGADCFNTAVVIERDGALAGSYRKVHIPQIPLWEEKFYFKPGDAGFPVFQTSVARIGVQTCWDNFFPEGSRILALRGAQIIFAPTASAFASHARWERMISANAIANNVFVVRVNRVGAEGKQEFYGKSFCVNPYGELVARPAASCNAILFAELNLDEVGETRAIWTFFNDRRPETYGDLLR